jgi:hypothetical protein
MNDQTSLMSRIGRWFNVKRDSGTLPVLKEVPPNPPGQIQRADGKARSYFWRPWARRDMALASLQQGFDSLADLMTGIRDNLQSQSRRQDEMLGYLSHLPQALESMPESQRVQGEALQAIDQHIQQQAQQQAQLTSILDKLTESNAGGREALESIAGRTQTLADQEEAISANLKQVGCAVENVGKGAESSAAVLKQLKSDLARRDGQMEETILQQNKRLTIMLIVAMSLSAVAIIAAGVVGYLLLRQRG